MHLTFPPSTSRPRTLLQHSATPTANAPSSAASAWTTAINDRLITLINPPTRASTQQALVPESTLPRNYVILLIRIRFGKSYRRLGSPWLASSCKSTHSEYVPQRYTWLYALIMRQNTITHHQRKLIPFSCAELQVRQHGVVGTCSINSTVAENDMLHQLHSS